VSSSAITALKSSGIRKADFSVGLYYGDDVMENNDYTAAIRSHFGDRLIYMVDLPGGHYRDVLIIAKDVGGDDRLAVADIARQALIGGSPVAHVLLDEKHLAALACEPAVLAAGVGDEPFQDRVVLGRQLAAMVHRAEGCLANARAEVKAGRIWTAVLAAASAVEHAVSAAVIAKGFVPASPPEAFTRFYESYIETGVFGADYVDWLVTLLSDRAVAERMYLLSVAPKDMVADIERATEMVISIKVYLEGEGFIGTGEVR
jgi:uncharacterized protein (UPF0332 family)